MKQLILQEILDDVQYIDWSTKKVEEKAIKFITNLFNYIINTKSCLDEYIPLAQRFWLKGIGGKSSHSFEIKKKLIENKILLDEDGLSKIDRRIKSYKFNPSYINNNIVLVCPFSRPLEINEISNIETQTKKIIENIKVDTNIDKISEIIKQELELLEINPEMEEFVNVNLDGNVIRMSAKSLKTIAKKTNQTIIKLKTKFYITEDIEIWKDFKHNEKLIIYLKQLLDIENNNIRVNRNTTNNRLDTNLTNLKSNLWPLLTLDGEKLIEIDIVNSQFAILTNILPTDEIFNELAISGVLYEYISTKLNITRLQAKEKMFRVVFDKVKKDQDEMRVLFPKTMETVDKYKKEHGYKSLSNLLQRTESNIMIDNVLYELLKKWDVVSVHDSIRVKESDYDEVLYQIKKITSELGLKITFSKK